MTQNENSRGASEPESSDSPEPSSALPAEPVTHGASAAEDPSPQSAEADSADPVESDPLEEARAEAARFKDQLLRTAADFDNFRKRTRRDISDAEKKGSEDLLREMLPVFDNLERAAAHAESATEVKSVAEGITMVMRQFVDTLKRLGIERVAGIGSAFDPMVHEAIQHLETDDVPAGTIAHEVQGGYMRGERLIRPALVVVAKPKASASTDEANEAPEEQSGE